AHRRGVRPRPGGHHLVPAAGPVGGAGRLRSLPARSGREERCRLHRLQGVPVKVSLLTATLPERAELLAEAVASVTAQTLHTFDDVEHIVLVDHKREGAGLLLDDALQLARG